MPKKTRPQITEVNCETNEVIIREMNDDEFASYQIIQNASSPE
jgi:hypothetical protein